MKRKANKRISWLKAIVISLILLLLVRFFCFQTYEIRGTNMSNTLLPGDLVLVNKLMYGPRMPNTLLFIPFTERRELSSGKYYFSWPQIPYNRMNGFSSIKNNDVLAFNYPEETEIPVDKRVVYIKRCAGLPGDNVQFKNDELFINKTEIAVKGTQYAYRVKSKTRNIDQFLIDRDKLQEGTHLNRYGEYILYMTAENAQVLAKQKQIISIDREKQMFNVYSTVFFPNSVYYKWNGSNFGSLIVPKKGDTIQIDGNNIELYRKIIEVYEKQKLAVLDNKILINNKEAKYYVFKMNYYFMVDDNRDNAKDSRNWGFLPEDHIIGKVTRVLFSVNKSESEFSFRLKRTFLKVH